MFQSFGNLLFIYIVNRNYTLVSVHSVIQLTDLNASHVKSFKTTLSCMHTTETMRYTTYNTCKFTIKTQIDINRYYTSQYFIFSLHFYSYELSITQYSQRSI